MSQIVYIAGKLAELPSIADRNKQVATLQAAEKTLRDKLDASRVRSVGNAVVLLSQSSTR